MTAKRKINAINLAGETLLNMQIGVYPPHLLASALEVLHHLLEDYAEARAEL